MSKVLAVGDIHTKLWIIDAVSKLIPNYDKVVFVGDYADDWDSGPLQTLETWKALKNLEEKYRNKVKILAGNHDYIYAYKTPTLQGGYNNLTQTLLNVPEGQYLKEWLKGLAITVSIDDVFYSHAGMTKQWLGSRDVEDLWDDTSPLWARPGDADYKRNFLGNGYLKQVFGHTPSPTCYEVHPEVWCIDTFSTYPDGTPVGDGTVLEIIDGKIFNKIKLETKDGNDNTTGVET